MESGLALEEGRRGMETLCLLPVESTSLLVYMSKFLEGGCSWVWCRKALQSSQGRAEATHQGWVELWEGIVDHALPPHVGCEVGDDGHGLLQLGTTRLCNMMLVRFVCARLTRK